MLRVLEVECPPQCSGSFGVGGKVKPFEMIGMTTVVVYMASS